MSKFVKKYPALSLFILAFVLGAAPLAAVQAGLLPKGFTQLVALSASLAGIILAAIVFWFWQQAREGLNGRLRRPLVILSVFTLFSLLTIRFTYLSSWPNADYAREFMVYAHGAPAAKSMVLDQIETLSTRMHGDKSIRVAFGGSGVSWPSPCSS